MTLGEVAQAVLAAGLASGLQPISISVRQRRIDLVIRDHRVLIEVVRGIVRIVWVGPSAGDGPLTKDERFPLDDADPAVVDELIRKAIDGGMTPF